MAVPFYVPETDEQRNDSSSQSQSTTTSATQTPLQSPVNGEHLVQAFYEALYRYSHSVAGTPGFPSPPPSPSCSSANSSNSLGYFVFPRSVSSSPRSPRVYIDGIYAWETPVNSADIRRRSRLNSTGEEDENECPSDSETTWHDEFEDHFNYMAARERLQEFPGRIPQKKKTNKKDTEKSEPKSKSKTKDQKFAWPTVVTAVVLAVGCGFLVTR